MVRDRATLRTKYRALRPTLTERSREGPHARRRVADAGPRRQPHARRETAGRPGLQSASQRETAGRHACTCATTVAHRLQRSGLSAVGCNVSSMRIDGQPNTPGAIVSSNVTPQPQRLPSHLPAPRNRCNRWSAMATSIAMACVRYTLDVTPKSRSSRKSRRFYALNATASCVCGEKYLQVHLLKCSVCNPSMDAPRLACVPVPTSECSREHREIQPGSCWD